jgi:hypothetical protein
MMAIKKTRMEWLLYNRTKQELLESVIKTVKINSFTDLWKYVSDGRKRVIKNEN